MRDRSATALLCDELAFIERRLDDRCPCDCNCRCLAHPVFVPRAWNSREQTTFRIGRCGHCSTGDCKTEPARTRAGEREVRLARAFEPFTGEG